MRHRQLSRLEYRFILSVHVKNDIICKISPRSSQKPVLIISSVLQIRVYDFQNLKQSGLISQKHG